MNDKSKVRFAFFGSSRLSVIVLDELKKAGLLPACVVTTPDKPQGRKLTMTPNVVKQWATVQGLPSYDFKKLDQSAVESLRAQNCEIFIVASYGKIIPKAVLEMPAHGTLNIHPSLLPKYRGASPLQSAILDDDKHTGVTIMKIDEEMDHGPIVAKKNVEITEWSEYEDFEEMMAREGTKLLIETLPHWIAGEIKELPQDHAKATFTRKFVKEDGLLDLNGDAYANFRKIQAFHEWPQAFFFIERNGKQLRIKVTKASFKNGQLTIEKVIPEGSKEMSYADFMRGNK